MMKKIIFFVFLGLLFITNSSGSVGTVLAQDSGEYKKVVLIINQVRGDECCDPGSKDYFQQQVDSLKENNLKGNFAVRYDALTDKSFTNLLKNLDHSQFELGAFLEITPNLAHAADVKYDGKVEEWYKAQNAYTVGYSFEDRKKIIDEYMGEFFSTFGYYPKFSTAWLMDTDSVNYMKEEYGLLAHQITREQWGTDSYTLSGGSIHYPYYASDNWLFAKSAEQSPADIIKGTVVLRQTGADPLFNYGDSTNSFTTQPNDYAIGKRGTQYFYDLKNQFLNQEQNSYGFLLLGLENSMGSDYQDEFSKQLASIEVDEENLSLKVSEFIDFFKANNQAVTGLKGKNLIDDTDEQSFWINAGNYRVRLLYKNNNLYISDLRLFNDGLEDPYNKYVANDLAFWVTPFIFNASQQYGLDELASIPGGNSLKNNFLHGLRKKYLPEFQKNNFEVSPAHNDVSSFFDGIKISTNIEKIDGFHRNESGILVLNLDNSKEIIFFEDHFETNFAVTADNLILEKSDFLRVDKEKDSFKVVFSNENLENNFALFVGCTKNICDFSFDQPTNDFFKQIREDYYPYFFPEIKDRAISNLKSVFYAHNQYAIADKNPVRLIFIPRDEKGFATSYKEEPSVTVSPEVKKVILRNQQANGTTFIDVVSQTVGKYDVTFMVGSLDDNSDSIIEKQVKIYFAPDCKDNLAYCILHPVELTWYLKSMFYTKLRDF